MPDLSNILLITDMDGTLLPGNKILSPKDTDAINRFRKDGGKFTIATGRTLQSAIKYIEKLEIDIPVILYNGSLIYDTHTDKVMFTDELPECAKDIARELFDFMKNPGGEVLRLDNIYVVCNNEYEQDHVRICQVEPAYSELDSVPEGGWFKILFADEPDHIAQLEEYVKNQNYPVDFVRSHDTFIEMLPHGSSKGAALKEYIKLMGMENFKVISAGDYHNDIEMIQAADIGAATANAQQDVKNAADVVLRNTSDEAAIAELIDMIYSEKI
ncbi:Cof-type HAD-IIB family hydrolase [Porcipelethomonas sp.]|uniref:Cof-type HAD-IIB family hydrolase n=1 Tax=Porcipelethomonas sp. TaxID=2981675 RepID=UPI003EF76CD4